jgi:hypothetical protein
MTPEQYSQYTENFQSFGYTKKDRFIDLLIKYLPISIKELKSKHPSIANGLNDLIVFAKGKPLTLEIVKEYRQSLSPEEFPVGYTAWGGIQRSIDTLDKAEFPRAQLVINVLASQLMSNKFASDPKLYDLFDKVNSTSKQSTHPYIMDQIGWIRLELDPNGQFILVDEIQSDHSNAASQLKSAIEYDRVNLLKNKIEIRHRRL